MNTCIAGPETEVHQFTGALEGFLGRIRIDDGLRLVWDDQRIGSANPADITLDFDHDAADDNVINQYPNPTHSDRT